MIADMHAIMYAIMYAKDPDATRRFFKDVLKWPHVDAGRGWLIFALPPAEVAAHPAEADGEQHELSFVFDDLVNTVKELKGKGVEFVGDVSEQPWGSLVMFNIPVAGKAGLYPPKHPLAIGKKG